MKKIMIIGCPGSGKSTFARKLRDKTGIELFHLDNIWHKADKTTISRDEFDAVLTDIMSKEQWIIDGNYQRTIPMRLEQCDTVFLLDFPVEVCIAGAEARVGTKREDMPWVEDELDAEFKELILNFSEKQLPQIYGLLEAYPGKEVHIFRSREETETFLSRL